MNKHLALLGFVLTGTLAHTAPFVVLDRMVELPPPSGYCALGATDLQRGIVAMQRKALGPKVVLLQVAVLCDELKKFDAGNIDEEFTRYIVVMIVKARGELKLDNRPRAEFLRSFGASQPIDVEKFNSNIEKVENRLRAALSVKSISVGLQSLAPIGSDGSAFYWSSVGEIQVEGGARRKIASVIAMLLVNGLPLWIEAAEHEGSLNGPALAPFVQKYVKLILSRNEAVNVTP